MDSSFQRMRNSSTLPPPPPAPSRSVRSVDRELRGYHTARPAAGSRDRRQSLPQQGHYSATAPRMGKRGMLREGQPAFRHWGSSLSLEGDDPGLGEITRRTLRPPSPKSTRERDPIPRTAKPVLPLLTQEEVNHPRLQDYLEKPRLHGCTMMQSGAQQERPVVAAAADYDYYGPPRDRDREFSPSEHHARRLANGDVPVYRNLRLGGFLESGKKPSGVGGGDELIPEVLRQYYLDTYLNTCYTA